MKHTLWLCLLALATLLQSQTQPKQADPSPSHRSLADFGLAYPLSKDWVLATEMSRKRMESGDSSQSADVLLAAVYVPKSSLSATNPFFTLLAYRQPATDCKRNLESLIAHSQNKEMKAEDSVKEFSLSGRDYYRINMPRGAGVHHQCVICTTASNRLLVWYAGATNEKGIDEILATLNSITPLPADNAGASAPASKPSDEEQKASLEESEGVKVASGVTTGLVIKKVNPVYPPDARSAYIQGTVVLRVEISKTGDITRLELVDGPIELAGSAVDAVRQWKYRPYLLAGQPVSVITEIKVNYQLGR